MKQYMLKGVALLTLLVLVGAGCAGTGDENTPATKNAETSSDTMMKDTVSDTTTSEDTVNNDTVDTVMSDTDITLTADARGETSVYFEWVIPEDTEYDGFILVRSEEANPENDGKNYWFRQHYTRRAITWTDIPAGNWHFRVCGVVGEDCAVYSNDVEVMVR